MITHPIALTCSDCKNLAKYAYEAPCISCVDHSEYITNPQKTPKESEPKMASQCKECLHYENNTRFDHPCDICVEDSHRISDIIPHPDNTLNFTTPKLMEQEEDVLEQILNEMARIRHILTSGLMILDIELSRSENGNNSNAKTHEALPNTKSETCPLCSGDGQSRFALGLPCPQCYGKGEL